MHPLANDTDFPKWVNPYVIKTPPGYSVLITQPFHRESVFTILPGIVDTDKYKSQVHFPFVLKDNKWCFPNNNCIVNKIQSDKHSHSLIIADNHDYFCLTYFLTNITQTILL